MELLQLRYFQTVAQFESITKAANYYNVPQPSMSQMIRKLEMELGNVKLFDRRNGRIYLNDSGRVFLEYVNKSLAELDNAISRVSEAPECIEGPIRIKIFENHRFILTSIPKFSKRYPDVNFIVSHGFSDENYVDYDLCVSSAVSYRSMTHAAPLIKEEVVLAVNEKHPLASREFVSINDLVNEKMISMPRHSAIYAMTIEKCHEYGFEPEIPIICDDPYFIRKYIAENMGIALAPSISWSGRFRSNTVLVPVKDPVLTVSSFLLWNDSHFLSPAVKCFRDFLLEEVSEIPGNLNI